MNPHPLAVTHSALWREAAHRELERVRDPYEVDPTRIAADVRTELARRAAATRAVTTAQAESRATRRAQRAELIAEGERLLADMRRGRTTRTTALDAMTVQGAHGSLTFAPCRFERARALVFHR